MSTEDVQFLEDVQRLLQNRQQRVLLTKDDLKRLVREFRARFPEFRDDDGTEGYMPDSYRDLVTLVVWYARVVYRWLNRVARAA